MDWFHNGSSILDLSMLGLLERSTEAVTGHCSTFLATRQTKTGSTGKNESLSSSRSLALPYLVLSRGTAEAHASELNGGYATGNGEPRGREAGSSRSAHVHPHAAEWFNI